MSSPWLQITIKSHIPEVFRPWLRLHRAQRCWSPSRSSATALRPNCRLGQGEPLSGWWRCPTQLPWGAVMPRKATHMLHGLAKCAWHRPRASKDNATGLDMKRTIPIKDEDTHILYWSEMLDIHPSRIAIFTLTGWTFVSFDIKNWTEVSKLGTWTFYRST